MVGRIAKLELSRGKKEGSYMKTVWQETGFILERCSQPTMTLHTVSQ